MFNRPSPVTVAARQNEKLNFPMLMFMCIINFGAMLLGAGVGLRAASDGEVVAGTSTPTNNTVDIFVHGGKTPLPPTTDAPPPPCL